jgi:thiosulfate/3-mercaptopyruvate sulfurtransferase
MSVLISPSQLTARIATGEAIRFLDVRWRLDRPDGRPEYLAGHLPGAVYVNLDTELATKGEPGDGRHPLPAVDDLQDAARRWGISEGDTVVVYDDLKNLSAARAWWLLRYAGLSNVFLLDGALPAWTGELEQGEVVPEPGDVTLSYGALPIIDIDAAADFSEKGVLLDARVPERFRGDVEPIDPRAGHIPGALNAPAIENVDADGRFLDSGALRDRFVALGVGSDVQVATYCGSGVTAAHNVAALMIAGFAPALYPGSWSQWSNSPEREVAIGD